MLSTIELAHAHIRDLERHSNRVVVRRRPLVRDRLRALWHRTAR